MKKKIFCFDVDNTICITKGKQYSSSKPIKEAITLINKLYSQGHIIKIFTFQKNNASPKTCCYLCIMDNTSVLVEFTKLHNERPIN